MTGPLTLKRNVIERYEFPEKVKKIMYDELPDMDMDDLIVICEIIDGAIQLSYQEGYSDGFDEGRTQGFNQGYDEAKEEAPDCDDCDECHCDHEPIRDESRD